MHMLDFCTNGKLFLNNMMKPMEIPESVKYVYWKDFFLHYIEIDFCIYILFT